MNVALVRAFRSEWLKRRRSFAAGLILVGSLFTPAIVVAVRLINYRRLSAVYSANSFWLTIWRDSWESMAIFFLPLCAILATSLVTQIEFRSNAWKQVHALPLSRPVIFASKLGVILVMLCQFLILFVAGVWLSVWIPWALVPGVPAPADSFRSLPAISDTALYFIDCLPIVATQYLLGLRIPNVLVPIGAGFLAWVAALASLSSRFAVWWPYGYTIINYVKDKPKGALFASHGEIHALALLFFVALTGLNYFLFATNRQKG